MRGGVHCWSPITPAESWGWDRSSSVPAGTHSSSLDWRCPDPGVYPSFFPHSLLSPCPWESRSPVLSQAPLAPVSALGNSFPQPDMTPFSALHPSPASPCLGPQSQEGGRQNVPCYCCYLWGPQTAANLFQSCPSLIDQCFNQSVVLQDLFPWQPSDKRRNLMCLFPEPDLLLRAQGNKSPFISAAVF